MNPRPSRGPRLVWSNPAPTAGGRISPNVLHRLCDVLVNCARRNEWQAARRIMAVYAPSPFVIAIIADRMSRAGITEDSVLRLI